MPYTHDFACHISPDIRQVHQKAAHGLLSGVFSTTRTGRTHAECIDAAQGLEWMAHQKGTDQC